MTPSTITLIGMPAAGKSTVGVLLAKYAGLRFVDTDLEIQVREGATLQQIVDREGFRRIRALDEAVVLDIDLDCAVIAPGGSVVYSEAAMRRLKAAGPVVYLEADLATLERRVAAAPLRGIACPAGQSYADVFAERAPLLQYYADITVNAATGSPESVARAILVQLQPAT